MKTRFLSLVFFLILVPPVLAASGKRAGDVVRVRGVVEVTGPTRKVAAIPRLPLLEDDQMLTAAASRAKMLFRDDSVLTLGPESRLVIRQYLYNPAEKRADSIYELLDGSLRSVVGNASFRVVTPTAYAAARGTIFLVWYDRERKLTGVAVIEGEVEVGGVADGAGEILALTAGQMTLVGAGRPPESPVGFRLIGPERYALAGYLLDFGGDYLPRITSSARLSAVDLTRLDLVRSISMPPFGQPPSVGDQGTAVGMALNFP